MTEKYYDEEIAPKLAELAQLCTQNGMSFVACVEYDPGYLGETRMLVKDYSFVMMMISMAIASKGNVDNLLISILRWTEKNEMNNDSIVLSRFLEAQA